MQTLDLRSPASAEPPAPEKPPGLERVRRFVAPVGRFFHGVWLWVRYLWEATAGFRKQAGPTVARAARATGRFAVRGERRARAGAVFLQALSRSGGRLRNTGRNWSRAEGRLGRYGARMSRAGQWTENAASGSAELLLGVAEAARELKRLRSAPPGSGDADRRLLPRAPTTPASPPESAPVEPEQPEGASGKPAAQSRPPERAPAAESPSPEGEPPAPAIAPPSAEERGGTAAPARRQRRRRQSRPDPPDDLPFALHGAILALGERPPQARTRSLVLKICAVREWVRPAELARWLGVGAANLTKRHLGPLTEQGLLERRYPESPRHRRQAYRTVKPPPPGGVEPPRGET